MNRKLFLNAVVLLLSAIGIVRGQMLLVGPGKRYAMPSQAIRAAKAGDVIEIDSAGTYGGDVAVIRTPNLTIRGVGKGRPKLDAKGKSAMRKGIWVQTADGLTVENIDFVGARCPDQNGSGIRGQGRNLTVRHCRFYDCENGILGGEGVVLIEHCEFDHCGHSQQSPTHSCYISGKCTRLTFQFNYSTHTLAGNLLKSRAGQNWVLYNRLTDEKGAGSAVADFPNGGLVVMLGNVMHKGRRGANNQLITYGLEGIKHQRNEVYFVHNTVRYEYRRPGNLVRVKTVPQGFRPVLRNNVLVGDFVLTNNAVVESAGNVVLPDQRGAGFVDFEGFDFHLQAQAAAIDQGVDAGKVDTFLLAPIFEYVHPCERRPRPSKGKPDAGAFEYAPGH